MHCHVLHKKAWHGKITPDSKKTRYLKENPKGVSNMCKIMEDLRDESYTEGKEEQARTMARNLYEQGISIEQIAKASGFDLETVKQWLTPKAG